MIIEIGKASVRTKGISGGGLIDTAVGKIIKCEFITA